MTPYHAHLLRCMHRCRQTIPFPDRNADLYFEQYGIPPMLEPPEKLATLCGIFGVSVKSPLPPWRYYGWLRLTVQRLHWEAAQVGVFPDRWAYFAEMWWEGKLPARSIIAVEYQTYHSGPALSGIEKCLKHMQRT
jgi:hypothetical protein